ncbi:MAG: tetratricopeptide repeat protein [Phycisphaerales bacterium]|nr:tetratricopeptide repeat protein [Phycisphaerales bacterium]
MNDWFDAEQHVEKAHEFYEAGRWDEAESELRRALSFDPYQPQWHFNLGLTLEAAGKLRDAMSAFRDAQRLQPDDAATALMLGITHLRLGEAERAIEWFERAEKLDSSGVDSYLYRIEAYARLGNHEQAEVMFYMAQQINPKHPELYAEMAESLIERRLYDRAVWCLREAANLDPELPRVQARLAEAYAATGRAERARQLYLLELRRSPGDIDTLLDLGCLLMDMHRYTEAGEKLRRVLEIEPDNADAQFHLGELAERGHQADVAARHYDVVLRLNASYPGAKQRLAAVMLRVVDGPEDEAAFARARDLLEQEASAIESGKASPDDEELLELGRLLIDTGLYARAAQAFTRLVERCPEQAAARHLLGVACLREGRITEGVEHERAALRIDRRMVPAMHNLAMAALHQEQWTRARYWVRHALRVAPDDASLRRLLLRLRLHRLVEAVSWAGGAVTPSWVERWWKSGGPAEKAVKAEA